MDSIGEKIRIQRLTKNFSQEYMSFMLDISQAAYSNLERNETELTIRRIYEIAEILEISPFVLLPKPKFGTYIDYHNFVHTIRKIGKVWSDKIYRRKKSVPAHITVYDSDITKPENE
ncbi:helix-turn-helix domain-containing protein [Mucilaginibacter aquariorum]|uniref:Helix-turn-helix domain-containing protein n=1 Tax=Mucilaginibacter aquariorum TaxID=2967225 RepID=A0ABT1SZ58_9SPHI|nr:helix-turn-helix transcriptional regulator [Mucilaginibacter aquariorum]MCQ6957630.1 helix-turn-helix domain-containing protein [Mucilaginibacter aquariorum]